MSVVSLSQISTLLVLIVVYLGFYFPDPHYFSNKNAQGLQILLLALRVLGAVVIGGFIFLQVKIKKKPEIRKVVLIVLCSSLLSGAALVSLVGIVDSIRKKSVNNYHSFLQITPPSGTFKSINSMKIAFLGGSTTAWPDSTKRDWPHRVEGLLAKELNQEISTLNVGKEWYTTQHTLINYLTNVRKLRPDVIVVMQSINDLLYNADFSYLSSGEFRPDYGHFAGVHGDWFKRRGTIGNYLVKLKAAWYHFPREVVKTDKFPGLSSYTENLKLLIRNATQDGVQVILMTEATRLAPGVSDEEDFFMVHYEAVGPNKQWDLNTAITGMELYNNAVREVSREMKVGLIDLAEKIPRKKEFFSDEVHFKDAAFDLVAQEVTNGLKKEINDALKNRYIGD
jgi:lysophospholipase L1-like esterase